MPSHRTHKKITEIILGKPYSDVHTWIDEPVKTLGFNHRILRHSLPEIAAKYAGDPQKLAAAAIHLATDFSVTGLKKEIRKRIRNGS